MFPVSKWPNNAHLINKAGFAIDFVGELRPSDGLLRPMLAVKAALRVQDLQTRTFVRQCMVSY